ncbi:MAG: 3-dehydroquinate synthase [Candidatus Omnitrophica bacterium]|nr:3-dehydroquinate synthase [Candidatus Omnitrophota bacterium]
MKMIQVSLKQNSYPICVGCGILSRLPGEMMRLKLPTDVIMITNACVRRLHGNTLAKAFAKSGFTIKIVEVEDSERAKSAEVAFDLVGKIASYAADKKPVIVALGGGVVGDLAGFVAAVYKRGIPFVQVPTTFLAQIDSSIGGKVAVDLPQGKNLMGAFYQPKLVFADVALLATLSDRQIKNGLAEAVKYGVIKDAKLFAFIEDHIEKLLAKDLQALALIVERSVAIKARVVTLDEKEAKGLRTILNFGHTVGHAIEAAGGYDRYQHGEAVALGMRAATDISVQLKLLKPVDAARIHALLTVIGLPKNVEGISARKIMAAMKFDKKFEGKQARFVLAQAIGRVVVRAVPAQAIVLSV